MLPALQTSPARLPHALPPQRPGVRCERRVEVIDKRNRHPATSESEMPSRSSSSRLSKMPHPGANLSGRSRPPGRAAGGNHTPRRRGRDVAHGEVVLARRQADGDAR
jgi:hypothetical protein